LRRAKEMLAEHGLGLTTWPTAGKSSQVTLEVPDRLLEREDYDKVIDAATDVLSGAGVTGHLVVVFCEFRFPAAGLTVQTTSTRCLTRPFCMVQAAVSSDNVTLLHEVGHAAGLDHDKTSTDAARRNFMHEATTRTTMMRWQVEKLAGAFFTGT